MYIKFYKQQKQQNTYIMMIGIYEFYYDIDDDYGAILKYTDIQLSSYYG